MARGPTLIFPLASEPVSQSASEPAALAPHLRGHPDQLRLLRPDGLDANTVAPEALRAIERFVRGAEQFIGRGGHRRGRGGDAGADREAIGAFRSAAGDR